jgi:hypothetical protein
MIMPTQHSSPRGPIRLAGDHVEGAALVGEDARLGGGLVPIRRPLVRSGGVHTSVHDASRSSVDSGR